jgi:predicted metal-binding membrane protein
MAPAEKRMPVPVDDTLEAVVRRDRLVVITALIAVIALSWVYLLAGAGMGMSQLGAAESMAMLTPAVWTPGYAVLVFFMWWVMMMAMMLPSAAPMILLLSRRAYSRPAISPPGQASAWSR